MSKRGAYLACKKKKKGGLGKSLLNQSRNEHKTVRQRRKEGLGDAPVWEATMKELRAKDAVKLESQIEQSDLQEFIFNAELEQRSFQAERGHTIVLDSNAIALEKQKTIEAMEALTKRWNDLPIPKRPKWDESTTKAQLYDRERACLLRWRHNLRDLLDAEENLAVTPYEKNLEVWRQLWRVVERSDVLVQIIDSRNPTLFRCLDLEDYVVENGAKPVLLFNKADFLHANQRIAWAKYLNENNIQFAFFSAFKETERLLELARIEEERLEGLEGKVPTVEAVEGEPKEEKLEETMEPNVEYRLCTDAVLTTPQLWSALKAFKPQKTKNTRYCVGMVGYPNVGKSSTINVLYGSKKVAVSATPAKTKHFQTLIIDDTLELCDCPGLVFANFMASKADMVINGLMRSDEMRDAFEPAALIASRVERDILERTYGINLPGEGQVHPRQLLHVLGSMRGCMGRFNQVNVNQVSRILVKDYINGKLLYSAPPMSHSIREYRDLAGGWTVFTLKDPIKVNPSLPAAVKEVNEKGIDTSENTAYYKHPLPNQQNRKINTKQSTKRRLRRAKQRGRRKGVFGVAQENVVANTTGRYASTNLTRAEANGGYGRRLPTNVKVGKRGNKIMVATTTKK